MEKDQIFLRRIQELAHTAYSRDIVTFTGFLNLNELHTVNSLRTGELGVTMQSSGGYEFAERQIVAFLPDALSYDWEYPIRCVRILVRGGKFAGSLTHRDYLGALIHLGIDRSTLGDILVKQGCAWVFCLEHLAPFILENLCRVKNVSVSAEIVEDPGELPSPEVELLTGTVSSLRLDSILALAFRASRSSLVQNIEGGNVFVNGKMVTSNGHTLRDGDVVSLRGRGKFRYVGAQGQSRKGRRIIFVERYI